MDITPIASALFLGIIGGISVVLLAMFFGEA